MNICAGWKCSGAEGSINGNSMIKQRLEQTQICSLPRYQLPLVEEGCNHFDALLSLYRRYSTSSWIINGETHLEASITLQKNKQNRKKNRNNIGGRYISMELVAGWMNRVPTAAVYCPFFTFYVLYGTWFRFYGDCTADKSTQNGSGTVIAALKLNWKC